MDDRFETLLRIRGQLPVLRGHLAAARMRGFRGEPLEVRPIYAHIPAVYHRDAAEVVQEAISRADSEEEKAQLASLHAAVQLERIRVAGLEQEEQLALAGTTARLDDGTPLPVAERLLRNERRRERRLELAEGIARQIEASNGKRQDRLSLLRERISSLGGGAPYSFLAALAGVEPGALAQQADATLSATEDAYRELGDWALSRHGSDGLGLRDAADPDLTWLEGLSWLGGIFPAGGLRLAALETFDAMGFDVRRRGVRLDLEKRPLQPAGARVFAMRIPSQVQVVLSPAGTPADWRELFGALGQGFGLASVSPMAPMEDVWTREGIVGHALGGVLTEVVGSPLFLRRKLGATRSEADQASRGMAFASLLGLRRLCGRVLAEEAIWGGGPGRSTTRTVAEAMERSLGVPFDERLAWLGQEPELPAAVQISGLSLAPSLDRALIERFDEDWWRNPRTGPWLQGLFARGPARVPAEFEPSLASWGERLTSGL